mmetsp:Transcript_88091/g.265115  ORF Transcript_88091/g.265115 Transcript_88091/m.265115 type:complete len:223 (-) Transcript_88091:1270-1938(-)
MLGRSSRISRSSLAHVMSLCSGILSSSIREAPPLSLYEMAILARVMVLTVTTPPSALLGCLVESECLTAEGLESRSPSTFSPTRLIALLIDGRAIVFRPDLRDGVEMSSSTLRLVAICRYFSMADLRLITRLGSIVCTSCTALRLRNHLWPHRMARVSRSTCTQHFVCGNAPLMRSSATLPTTTRCTESGTPVGAIRPRVARKRKMSTASRGPTLKTSRRSQ